MYVQVVMIRRRELDDKKEKDKTKIYNFQGKSAGKKHWFGPDHEWLKKHLWLVNQISIKKLYQNKFRGDNTQKCQKFGVSIGNSKMTKKVQLHPEALLIQYHQKWSNSFVWVVWHQPLTV